MKLLFPILLFVNFSVNAQNYSKGMIMHGDTLFLCSGLGDSIQINKQPRVWGTFTGTLSNQTDLQDAFNLKATLASPTFTGTVGGITASMVGLGNVTNESKATMFTSPAFTGTATGLTASMVGLGNVTNESKATMFTSPAFTGTATGLTASMVGLGNVTNESKTTMFASPAFTGTATGIGIPVYAQVTGSNATTTGQALTNITGLSVALTTSATYEFEAILSVSTSAVTTGTAYGVQYSVAGGTVEASITGSSTSTATKTLRITALNSATALYLATSAQTGGILIKGRITTGANAGNLTIQHLKLTSGTSTVFIGSMLKVTRIN